MAVRVLLADDHKVVREGLQALLEREGFEVIGKASNGKEAIELAQRFHPEIAVLDVAMPILNGIDAAREISKANPGTRSILLTMLTEDHYVLESLRAGVRGYVLKSQSAQELAQAIHEVCKGGIYLTPDASSAVVQAYLSETKPSLPALSPRERQVLQLVAEGSTTKEIAVNLGISVKTAESHRQNVMNHLGIHETAGLVRYAIREGLIQP
jgi:DNA-binding NarL/FixJ family response regulator